MNMGGFKSPSMRREWIEIPTSIFIFCTSKESPSMRREWIEISGHGSESSDVEVSLHAEGVD